MTQCNTHSYAGSKVYCGFDVHKNSWSVCVRVNGIQADAYRMDASVDKVVAKLKTDYPDAEFHSVYEAGFSGFSAHRRLVEAGFHNIVVNPADVPTSGRERAFKSDDVDCRKLAKHLESGDLHGIDIPSEDLEKMRSLVRRETQLRDAATRCNNQLRGSLLFHGRHEVPDRLGSRAVEKLRAAAEKEQDEETLSLVRELVFLREERQRVIKAEKELQRKLGYETSVGNLATIPGIAWRSATILQAELGDIGRFPTRNQLASYVGVAPHLNGSGDKEKATASGSRKKRQLHYLLVQAAWVAAMKDNSIRAYYCRLCRGRTRTRAIVGVAKKLLMLVNAVLRTGRPYDGEKLRKAHPELEEKIRKLEGCAEKPDAVLEKAVVVPEEAGLPCEEDILAEYGEDFVCDGSSRMVDQL